MMKELSLNSEPSVKPLSQNVQRVSCIDLVAALHGSSKPRAVPARLDENTPARALPIFGLTPCSAYCSRCRTDVHTDVEFAEEGSWSRSVLNFLGLLDCCRAPAWLNQLRVHKCPHCSTILANICK